MSEACLSGANLGLAALSGANLSGAMYDDTTKWSDGFEPVEAGAKKMEQRQSEETDSNKSASISTDD